ncbi:Gfo/Idh/MocA family oxidoreductase, partial [Nocardia salmonicida]
MPDSTTPPRTLRIAMNGVTGRMGYRQHLMRSILPIRDGGGLLLADGTRVQVEPILVGRNAAKLAELADEHGIAEWSTDAAAVIADPSIDIYFDAQVTSRRAEALTAAMKAGKHVFTEKSTAETLAEAVELARVAANAGIT